MKRFFGDWKPWKHLLFSLIICSFIRIILNRFDQYNESFSIGIAGGVDGPTAVFISGNTYTSVVINVFTAIVFFVVLALYVPIRIWKKRL